MPTNEFIIELLKVVLASNNFQFNDENYLQVGGTAMGTKVALILGNIFYGWLWEKIYLCYVVPIWTNGQEKLDQFLHYLTGCQATIKFMMESSTTHIKFLDTKLHKDKDGHLWTDI